MVLPSARSLPCPPRFPPQVLASLPPRTSSDLLASFALRIRSQSLLVLDTRSAFLTLDTRPSCPSSSCSVLFLSSSSRTSPSIQASSSSPSVLLLPSAVHDAGGSAYHKQDPSSLRPLVPQFLQLSPSSRLATYPRPSIRKPALLSFELQFSRSQLQPRSLGTQS